MCEFRVRHAFGDRRCRPFFIQPSPLRTCSLIAQSCLVKVILFLFLSASLPAVSGPVATWPVGQLPLSQLSTAWSPEHGHQGVASDSGCNPFSVKVGPLNRPAMQEES